MELYKKLGVMILVASACLGGLGCKFDDVVEQELGQPLPAEKDSEGGGDDRPTVPSADSGCDKHSYGGSPVPFDIVRCLDTFSIGYNYHTKQPYWVSYSVTADSVAAYVDRTDDFREDLAIPEPGRSTLGHYKGSGYDRGHLAPAATVGVDEPSMSDTFLLSNMSPQLPGFNRDGWAEMESLIRDCVYELKSMSIVSGPVINDEDGSRIGNDGPVVPDGFFKLLIHDREAYAIVVPHEDFTLSEMSKYVVSPRELQEATGIDFFPGLTAEEQDTIEINSVDFCSFN